MSRCLRLGSSSLAVLSRLGPCLDRLLSLIADCDLTILSCSRLSFCRGNPEDSHGQKFPFLTQIVVQYLNFIDQLKRVVGSIACWCCSAGLLMNATSKIDWFSSVRADFLCTNFQAKCSDVRRRRPPGRSRRRDILDLGHGQERDCGALWTTVVFRWWCLDEDLAGQCGLQRNIFDDAGCSVPVVARKPLPNLLTHRAVRE